MWRNCQKYQGSHEDFDAYVVPTVPALKQQQDTIATLVELARLRWSIPKETMHTKVDHHQQPVIDTSFVCQNRTSHSHFGPQQCSLTRSHGFPFPHATSQDGSMKTVHDVDANC
jgi:hypothetical protein